MGAASTPRHHPPLPKRIFAYALYALLPLAALHYLLLSPPPPPLATTSTSTTPPVAAVAVARKAAPRCDYSEGEWLVRGGNGGDGGDVDEARKFRRWVFPSHNATVSVFWSPFLVNGTEKSSSSAAAAGAGGLDHNRLYLDQPDERWAGELDGIDVVVLSAGHWFLHPAMYYERGEVIGCHHCPEPNRTETGFFGVFRLAVKNALREVITRAARSPSQQQKLAVVTTFSPAHFEGEWDARDACARSEPYAPGEKEVGYMDREMWRSEAEEVAAAAADARVRAPGRVEVEALEVTAMAALRGDGHPGPYMNAFPFAGGERARVPNDCVHWCLPGPIDTWNEILLQLVKRWRDSSSK
ncbi:hypothetical protein OsI_31144 [Oryza sativa Indica Group]|uniref:Trichome birefringence-like C-terminal domain-containing protein n=1 Tax=Oryza sativa subsp. indica TaxID=39946 RepID=A2Z0M0_ORYSI|nr:hypothetical protein OsI_31144 [Oryza sativa Indica Group]